VAVAAGAAGAWCGLEARRAQDRLRDGSVHADATSLAHDAQRKATAANVLFAVSGGAAATGITFFVIEGRF